MGIIRLDEGAYEYGVTYFGKSGVEYKHGK